MTKIEKIDMKLYQEIGKLLKAEREKQNISLDKLSEYIHGKKTKSTLKRYEDGKSRIDVETLHDICAVLGLNSDDIVQQAGIEVDFGDLVEQKENDDFATAEDALKFILEQPIFASNIGYDPKKMTDEQLIKLANKIMKFTKMEIEDLEEVDLDDIDL